MSVTVEANAPPIDLTALSPESIITFPHGLVGQPEWKRFVLITSDEDGGLAVLQSVDNDQLSLMVTDPVQLLPEYVVELSSADRTLLGLDSEQQPLLLTTVSIHGEQITTNLIGPLVINPRTRAAKQVVLADTLYTTRYPVASVGSGK
jgi:flagellar assembly factor FliW